MVPKGGYDALRDHAETLGGPRLSAFGHAFCPFERYHRRRGQGQGLVEQALLQVEEMGKVEEAGDVHRR